MLLLLAPALVLVGATAQEPVERAEPDRFEPARPTAASSAADQAGSAAEDPGTRQGRLESLYEGALLGVVDAEDFAETPGYRRLLDILSRYGEEELRSKATRHLDVASALAEPDAWRGEIVRVRALLVDFSYVRLAQPLGDHVDAVRALLTEGDGSEGVFVDFLVPAETDLRSEFELERDVVEVEAVFFRTVRYENRKNEFVVAPQLIARGLHRLDQEALPRSTGFDDLAKILIGLAVAFLVIRILMTMKKSPVGRRRLDPSAALVSRALDDRARAPAPKP